MLRRGRRCVGLRRSFVAGPTADVAVRHRLEALDHVVVVLWAMARFRASWPQSGGPGEGGSRAGIGVKLHGRASGEMRKVRGGTGRSRVPFLTRPNGRRLGSGQPGAGGGRWNAGGGGPAGGGSAVQNLHARLAVLNLDVGLTASVDYIVLGDFNAGCDMRARRSWGSSTFRGPTMSGSSLIRQIRMSPDHVARTIAS